MNNNTLTNHQQRGTITYMNGYFHYTTYEGWFHLEGNYVIMRRIGSSKTFKLCNALSVHDFEPAE